MKNYWISIFGTKHIKQNKKRKKNEEKSIAKQKIIGSKLTKKENKKEYMFVELVDLCVPN